MTSIRNLSLIGLLCFAQVALLGLSPQSLQRLDVGASELSYDAPVLTTIGGDMAFSAVFSSEEPAGGQVFLTVLRQSGAMALPVVTRTGTTTSVGRQLLGVDFDLSLDNPRNAETYQLYFWTASNREDGSQDKIDLGLASLVVLPSDALEPLRKQSARWNFMVDSGATPTGLQPFFDKRGIGYSSTSASQIDSLGAETLFFTTDTQLATSSQRCRVVVISEDAPRIPILRQSADGGASIVLDAADFAGLADDAAPQLLLQDAVLALTAE